MTVKLVVIYPRPNDIEAFETVYNREHGPIAVAKLAGKTKIAATRVLDSPALWLASRIDPRLRSSHFSWS
jgi:hypothetical protein